MTVREYIGARYVPLLAQPTEWNKETAYEPLTIVLYQGNSYTSRQAVPIGVEITNEDYWALTGNYNAQIEQYRRETKKAADDAAEAKRTSILNSNAIKEETTRATQAETAIAAAVKTNKTAVNLKELLGENITDAEKFNNAIKNGGRFYIPAGIYEMNGTIVVPSNIEMFGDGDATVFKTASSVGDAYHSLCTDNAVDFGAREGRNTATGDYPLWSKYCDHKVTNVYLHDFKINGNQANRYTGTRPTWENPETGGTVELEYGTGIELQYCENVVLERITVINAIQHCINVRGGANSYNMGDTYVAAGPTSNVRITNCQAINQRVDDCITTHDANNVVISGCYASVPNNANVYSEAISNGIEIDDGSHDIVVENCISEYSFVGYQAKGHANTPPAYNVTFDNCIARFNQIGFDITHGTVVSTNEIPALGDLRDIHVLNCKIFDNYAFNNTTDYRNEVYIMQIQNAFNCVFENIIYDRKSTVTQANALSTCDRCCIWFRDKNEGHIFKNMSVSNTLPSTVSTMSLSGTSANIKIIDCNFINLGAITNNNLINISIGDSLHQFFIVAGNTVVKPPANLAICNRESSNNRIIKDNVIINA